MKKKAKKLELSKETLAVLESDLGFGDVAGAATASCTGCGPPGCPYSGLASCATGCGHTCTTNLC